MPVSPSASISASPSLPYAQFSRGGVPTLPTDTADLETPYSEAEETQVKTRNYDYVTQEGALEYMVHEFKNFVGNSQMCQIEWEGKSTLAPSLSPVFLQVYNHQTNSWQTIDSNGTAEEDVNFELEEKIRDVTNYKDGSAVITWRVYQLAI